MQNLNSKFKTNLSQRCFSFGLQVISLTDNLLQKRSAWVISDQLIRSATSIGANIIEARASSSRLEFKKYYEIALKSANETKYWLEMLREAKLANKEAIELLLTELQELSNMLGASVIKLKQKVL